MDAKVMTCLVCPVFLFLLPDYPEVQAGDLSGGRERSMRKYTRVRSKNGDLTKTSTARPLHFFETTRSEFLDWFRRCPVPMDNGTGSFFNQRMSELASPTKFIDKSYILKELGDKLAPSGRLKASKALYLTGFRFLEDERTIDMIVKFFDIETDKDGVELPESQKINKKLFAGGQIMVNNSESALKPLFVSETYLWEYQGTIPCVLLNFNKFKGTTYDTIRREIAAEIRKMFDKFSYLFRPSKLSKRTLNTYETYASGDVTHDELYNAILFVVRMVHKTYRRQVLFILNDGEDTVIVNYKGSVSYVISDSFGNLKFQLLHKYANLVRRNMRLNQTDAEAGNDRITLGSLEYERSTKKIIKHRKMLRPFKLKRLDKKIMDDQPKGFHLERQTFDVQGKDLFGFKGDGLMGIDNLLD